MISFKGVPPAYVQKCLVQGVDVEYNVKKTAIYPVDIHYIQRKQSGQG
jgi:hypothetical protein